jgi:hypothetical protein
MLFTLEGETYGDLSAAVEFTYTGLSYLTGRIDVALTNTSSAGDPRLTGFAFNLPSTVLAVFGFDSSASGWSGRYDRNDIDTPGRFGFFDLAGFTSSTFGGGSPNAGIARNTTARFSFDLLGLGMGGLTESSFLNLLSYDPHGSPNESQQYFIGRFQRVGEHGGQSDVATPNGRPASVPEPATLLLTGLGLLGAAALQRRRA